MGEELIWAPELRAQSIAVGRVKLAGRKEGAAGAGGCAHLGGSTEKEWQHLTGLLLSVFIQSGAPPTHF